MARQATVYKRLSPQCWITQWRLSAAEPPALSWHILVHMRTWEHSEFLNECLESKGLLAWEFELDRKKKIICNMLELRHCVVILIGGGLFSQTVEGYAVTLTFLFPTMCISFWEVIFSSSLCLFQIFPSPWNVLLFSKVNEEISFKLIQEQTHPYLGFAAHLDSGLCWRGGLEGKGYCPMLRMTKGLGRDIFISLSLYEYFYIFR